MNIFNIIVGLFSIVSGCFTVMAYFKIVAISNSVNIIRGDKVDQSHSGSGDNIGRNKVNK